MSQKNIPLSLRLYKKKNWNSCWILNKDNYSDLLHLNLELKNYFEKIFNYKKLKLIKLNIVKISNNLNIYIFFYKKINLNKKKNLIKKKKKYPIFKIEKNFLTFNKQKKLKFNFKKRIKLKKKIYLKKKILRIKKKNFFLNLKLKKKKKKLYLKKKKFSRKKNKILVQNLINKINLYYNYNTKIYFKRLFLKKFFYNRYKIIYFIKKNNFIDNNLKKMIYIFGYALYSKNINIILNYIQKKLERKKYHRKIIKQISNILIEFFQIFSNFIGFKLQFKGRLNGKKRKNKIIIQKGKIPLNSLQSDIHYGFNNFKTPSGICSIKLFVFLKKKKKYVIKKKKIISKKI